MNTNMIANTRTLMLNVYFLKTPVLVQLNIHEMKTATLRV